MNYFITNELGTVISVITNYVERAITRNDFDILEQAEAVAKQATEATGELYIAVERPNTFPRFDVIRAPQVGDEVSRGFNGDYYPCGKIVKVSKTMKRVQTSDGTVFYRRRDRSPQWLEGGCFAMVQGRRDERNPSF